MNDVEIATMLAACNTLDGRVSSDVNAVEVWREVIDDDIDPQFAGEHVRRWYGNNDDPMTPASLNKAWRDDRRVQRAKAKAGPGRPGGGIPCPFPDCVCTHDNGCVAGWLDKPDGPTSPCPVCRPGLRDLLTDIPGPGDRTGNDFATIREGRTSRWSNGADKA